MQDITAPREPVPNSELVLRARQLGDAEAIAAMASLPGYRRGTMRLPFPSLEDMRSRIEKTPPGAMNIVATVAASLVGEAGMFPLAGRQAHVAEIGIGVHDDWTGRGVGSRLLAALIDAADNWRGLRRLQLTVFADNTPAIRLYEKFGFVTEGTLRAFALRDGVYADALSMARLGGPGWPPP